MSYARTAVTRMTLDMSRLDLQRSETVTLGDTNRRWEVTLINGGAPFRLPNNWTAALTGIKPDGTGLLNGCSVADGKIIYDFAAGKEIATCAGNYPVQFDIWDEVGNLVASPKLYVNVLADVRPHAELESNGQYTRIGELIGRVNQTDADVDLLTENVLANADQIAALEEKVTTVGTVTIPVSQWEDDSPTTASFTIEGLGNGMTALLYPIDKKSKDEAIRVKMSANPMLRYVEGDTIVEAIIPSADNVPTIPIDLNYIIIKSDNSDEWASAVIIGVDAYGEGGGTASGVDEEAVKKIIEENADAKGTAQELTDDLRAEVDQKIENLDGVYAKPSDIPDVPTNLPNPKTITILGKTYDGSAAVEVTVDEIIIALKQSGEVVIGTVGDDKTIILDGDLAPGDYTFAYLVKNPDGTTETVTIGTYTVEDESETKTYTITWVNYDGTVLETDTVKEGVTPTYDGATPTRAADDQYTYTFAGWDKTVVAATADATYTATYTQTAKPTELPYTNLLDGVIIEQNKKMSTSSGTSATQDGACATDFIAIPAERVGEVFRIYNVSLHVNERVNNILFYDESKTKLGAWAGVAGAFSGNVVVKNGVYYFTPNLAYANVRYIRFSCGVIDSNSIVTLGEEIA